jgi:Pyruvate/2-oxoacid:ferredoxin oxidoreductase delta subunit
MKWQVNLPSPRARSITPHRPEQDPACAGCLQLGLLRGLRRCGIEAAGRLGCEPGRGLLLADVTRGEARVRLVAGPVEPDARLLPSGAAVVRLEPGDLEAVEKALWRALTHPGDTLFLAISPCTLAAPRRAALAIVAARCNRCGQCLTLGCPAISELVGEAMIIDAATCTGCGLCAPICRARAIGPALHLLG